MANLKVGDVVRLKAGSQQMTVDYVEKLDSERTRVSVIWFDSRPDGSYSSDLKRQSFLESSLVKVELDAK